LCSALSPSKGVVHCRMVRLLASLVVALLVPHFAMAAFPVSFPQLLDSWTVVPIARSLVKLGVPDAVPEDGAADLQEVAVQIGADPEMLRRAIVYVAGFGVFKEDVDGKVSHTDVSLQLRIGGALHKKVLYRASHEIVLPYVDGFTRVLQDPTKSAFEHLFEEDYFTQWLPKHPESEALFSEYMSEATSAQTPLILGAYPWPHQGVVADIGGGNGHLLRALMSKASEISGVLFDLPSTIATAKKFWPDGDVMHSGRVSYIAGNFFDSVNVTADVYVLKWILHDWSDEKSITILSNIGKSADASSVVIVIDMLVPDDMPNSYHITKFFDMHMAAGYGGKERSASQMASLAKAAGWVLGEILPVGKSPFACFALKRPEVARDEL